QESRVLVGSAVIWPYAGASRPAGRTGSPRSGHGVADTRAENDMAGMRQAVWIAVLLSGWLAGAAVRAETIPLPTPAPAPKDRSTPAPPAAVPSNTTQSAPTPP